MIHHQTFDKALHIHTKLLKILYYHHILAMTSYGEKTTGLEVAKDLGKYIEGKTSEYIPMHAHECPLRGIDDFITS